MFITTLIRANSGARKRSPKKSLRATVRGWFRKTVFSVVALSILFPLALRWVPPPITAFMLQARRSPATVKYNWVPHRSISPNIAIAAVAAEDQKFPRHWGFDFNAIESALQENRQRKSPLGASTISQQVAKNLFLWSGRSYIRKGIEAYLTVVIELLWPKQRILEVYLNIAEFGPGVYGVEAASQKYFNKPARRLSKNEAALLAAVLPNPRKMSVRKPSHYVRQRAGKIKRQMAQLGGIRYLKGIWNKK